MTDRLVVGALVEDRGTLAKSLKEPIANLMKIAGADVSADEVEKIILDPTTELLVPKLKLKTKAGTTVTTTTTTTTTTTSDTLFGNRALNFKLRMPMEEVDGIRKFKAPRRT